MEDLYLFSSTSHNSRPAEFGYYVRQTERTGKTILPLLVDGYPTRDLFSGAALYRSPRSLRTRREVPERSRSDRRTDGPQTPTITGNGGLV